jgi:crossover junction endodeoxyribonuclease RusA
VIIVVRGTPAPQGSKRHVGRGRMIEQSRAVGPWREAIRAETQRVMITEESIQFLGPVAVKITFLLPRPKSTPKRITQPAKRPDLDKLARSVLDGLTMGGAWEDDAQVVELWCRKRFAPEGTAPGCKIVIQEEA